MKTIIFIFAVFMGGLLYLHHCFENGSVLKYVDDHAYEKGIPKVTYTIGQAYYLFQDLQQASTYFVRVAQRYPDLPLADDAYFAYLQCLDDNATVSRAELVEGYKAYLEKYPHGHHTDLAQERLGTYTTGGH